MVAVVGGVAKVVLPLLAQYAWPVVLAGLLARREIRRRREQDALRAQQRAEQYATYQPRSGPDDDDDPRS